MQEEKDAINILPIILFLIILIPFSIWFFSINQHVDELNQETTMKFALKKEYEKISSEKWTELNSRIEKLTDYDENGNVIEKKEKDNYIITTIYEKEGILINGKCHQDKSTKIEGNTCRNISIQVKKINNNGETDSSFEPYLFTSIISKEENNSNFEIEKTRKTELRNNSVIFIFYPFLLFF